jgi:hypothetical protein
VALTIFVKTSPLSTSRAPNRVLRHRIFCSGHTISNNRTKSTPTTNRATVEPMPPKKKGSGAMTGPGRRLRNGEMPNGKVIPIFEYLGKDWDTRSNNEIDRQ